MYFFDFVRHNSLPTFSIGHIMGTCISQPLPNFCPLCPLYFAEKEEMPIKRHPSKHCGLAAHNKRRSENKIREENNVKCQRVQDALKKRVQTKESLSGLGAILLIQTIQFQVLVQHFYCTHCNTPLEVSSSTSSIHFTLHLKCCSCGWKQDWENTSYTAQQKSRLLIQF